MSVDFGQNVDDKIGINTLRNIGSPHPQITGIRLSNCDVFDLVIRRFLWHNTMRSEIKNLAGNLEETTFSKFMSAKIILNLEKLGAKVL